YITDVSPLATLTGLEELYIAYNEIEDISPLAKLPNLEKAWVEGNHITDFTAVEDVLVEADN
ncbi:MAG: leucine-rich repeat domain-containing protein, partial [Oscillospiraceae bacterium]